MAPLTHSAALPLQKMWLHPLSAQSHSHQCCPSENGTDAARSSQVEGRLSALGGKQSVVSATVTELQLVFALNTN